ncbi:aminopeptidase [Serratia sp. S1B]|nr:aminopeptidase [Serratia sp. S1B]
MFFRLCLKTGLLLAAFSGAANLYAAPHQAAKEVPLGQFAANQIRYIATYFPGRMAGSPAEMLAADYLKQQFTEMGYPADTRSVDERYLYTNKNHSENWHKITFTSVIAAKNGDQPKQIIIMTHFDTYTPVSDDDVDNNLGGLTLQGVDDNASGVGVMLELANRLKDIPTTYSLRFIATSGDELHLLGTKNYLQRMSPEERENTLLVINLDNLITGDHLYFQSGDNPQPDITKQPDDQALSLAHRYGIDAAIVPAGKNSQKERDPNKEVFDQAKIPFLSVEATNWLLGRKDGYQQRAISPSFPQGISWHRPQYDNLQYLETHLPGRIEKRSHDSVQILLPLIKELAQARPVAGVKGNKGK